MAKYTNSKLATKTNLSPNHSGERNQPITKIVIHHTAGKISADTIGNIFKPVARQASCNYGVGHDGEVILVVDEKNRSWCSSSSWVDNRAVTIEVSNSANGGNWPVSDKVLAVLIDLVTDICKRNGIKNCTYTGDKNGVLQKHEWYAPTLCPGPYLGSKFSYIAKEANKRLKNNQKPAEAKPSGELYRVRKSWSDSSSQIGAFKFLKNAKKTADKNVGYNVYDSAGSLVYDPSLHKAKKTTSQLAKEVLNGAWGNGSERKAKLTAAGYDYTSVQNEVNRLLKKQKDSNYEEKVKKAAQDVWAGKYGNNPKRAAKLKSEGLNPDDVQTMVNKLYY